MWKVWIRLYKTRNIRIQTGNIPYKGRSDKSMKYKTQSELETIQGYDIKNFTKSEKAYNKEN